MITEVALNMQISQKSEYRSTKCETNPNFEYSKFKTAASKQISFWSFLIWHFDMVSDFEFRISSFTIPYLSLPVHTPPVQSRPTRG